MLEKGILDLVLSTKVRSLIFSIVPDATLYHLHAYEIAGNATKSQTSSDAQNGWRRDSGCEHFRDDPTHVSLIVHLEDVGDEDGALEFSPQDPEEPLRTDSPIVSMTGPAGMSFVWRRSYYRRASPNRGPKRRRLLKVSVQPNDFPSESLGSESFKRVCAEFPRGHVEWDLLLGRYRGGIGPRLVVAPSVCAFALHPSGSMKIVEESPARLETREIADARKPVVHD